MPSRHTPRLTRPDPGRELRTLRACGEQPLVLLLPGQQWAPAGGGSAGRHSSEKAGPLHRVIY